MINKIINHIKNPYVTLADSFIIMVLALTSSCLAVAITGTNTFISSIILTLSSVFLGIIHNRQFENKKKNYVRGYSFCIMPIEIVIVIAMLKYSMNAVKISLIVSVVFVLVYLIVFFAVSQKRRFKKTNCIRGIHSILAICLTPCIISFFTHWIGDVPILERPPVLISTDVNYSASPITTDEWDDMSFNQRFTYLNKIMKAEASNLSMTNTPNMEAIFYPEALMGTYDHNTDTIGINAEYLRTADADEVINTLGHELYHRQEYIIIEDSSRNVTGVSEERIAEYKYDFENPSNMVFDWDGYYNMSTEVDARTVGEQIADKYVI